MEEIADEIIKKHTHFFEMQNGTINQTELVAAIINQKENFMMQHVQHVAQLQKYLLNQLKAKKYSVKNVYLVIHLELNLHLILE